MRTILVKPGLVIVLIAVVFSAQGSSAGDRRVREYGVTIGVLNPGKHNAITDVKGVSVGHTTLIQGDNVRTGVTAILPHSGNIFQSKVPAAMYVANGFGKLAGYTQVEELGNTETPIILTNTLSVPTAANALIEYTLGLEGNEDVRSVNPIVGETNDGWLNDIRGRHVKKEHVLHAIEIASAGPVEEGSVGAGTGTRCLGFKGGIGTSSRILSEHLGGYTVGVLVQTNFGGLLVIDGVPVGRELERLEPDRKSSGSVDGSCMMVVATDAPLTSRNLKRLAKRAAFALAKTGSVYSNGSGDYVIAFSTGLPIPNEAKSALREMKVLRNEAISPLFMAVMEATEEAVLNSLFAAESMTGRDGHKVDALPIDDVIKILKKHNRLE
jgi:D-aminopeptidase